MPNEAIPALIMMGSVIGLGLVLLWRWVLRPMVQYARRRPCGRCGLSFTADDTTCPHCGAERIPAGD